MSININSLTIEGNRLVSRLVLDANYAVRLPTSSNALEFIDDNGVKVDLPLVSYNVPVYHGDVISEVAVPFTFVDGAFDTPDELNVRTSETVFYRLNMDNELVKVSNAEMLDIANTYARLDKEEVPCLGTWFDNHYDNLDLIEKNSHLINAEMVQKLFEGTNYLLNPNTFRCYNVNGTLTDDFIKKVLENYQNPKEITLSEFEYIFDDADDATNYYDKDVVGKIIGVMYQKDFGKNKYISTGSVTRRMYDNIEFYKIVEL